MKKILDSRIFNLQSKIMRLKKINMGIGKFFDIIVGVFKVISKKNKCAGSLGTKSPPTKDFVTL